MDPKYGKRTTGLTLGGRHWHCAKATITRPMIRFPDLMCHAYCLPFSRCVITHRYRRLYHPAVSGSTGFFCSLLSVLTHSALFGVIVRNGCTADTSDCLGAGGDVCRYHTARSSSSCAPFRSCHATPNQPVAPNRSGPWNFQSLLAYHVLGCSRSGR